MINRLKDLTDKADDRPEQKGSVSRKVEILRNSQKGNLETKNVITKMKNDSHGLIVSTGHSWGRNL